MEFTSNQSEISNNQNDSSFFWNTKLSATTLRANSNRLTESDVGEDEFPSLEAHAAKMNTVIGNQVDHCISVTVDNGGQIKEACNASLSNEDPYCGNGSGVFDKKQYQPY